MRPPEDKPTLLPVAPSAVKTTVKASTEAPNEASADAPAEAAADATVQASATGAQVTRLSPFRAHLARSLTQRGRALVEAGQLDEVVPQLAPVELYFMVKEMGTDEAAPLLLAASDEQSQALCDLDCWDGETFVAEELDAWLSPLAAEGPEALVAAFLRLDEEIQVLFLQASLRVVDMRAQDGSVRKSDDVPWPDDVPEDAPWTTTPEGFFTLIDLSQDREVPPLELVAALRNHDAGECFRLLTAARWELVSPLMEQGLHFREGRLSDLGFVPAAEAERLFAPPPATAPTLAAGAGAGLGAPATSGGGLPATYAEALQQAPDCLLVRALAEVQSAAQLARLEAELVVTINAAIVAYGLRVKDLAQVAQVAGWTRDFLSLGLAAVAATTEPLAAASVLQAMPLQLLFRHGVATVRPLQQQALAAKQRPEVATWLAAAPVAEHDPAAADRAFVQALAAVHPLWAGFDSLRPERRRAWPTAADVAACQARLTALLAQL